MPATCVITMAGLGKRFRDAGYNRPKYEIVAHGRPLFAWSMDSLRSFIAEGSPFVFVVRAEDHASDFILREAERVGIRGARIVEIDHLTDGQATTAMLAMPEVAAMDEAMAVYNIDTFVHPRAMPASAARGDGWIPCFPGAGSAWSFVRTEGADDRGVEVREKKRISEHATVGLYWFSSAKLYVDLYNRHFGDASGSEAGERYIAPMYNTLIASGAPVYIHRVLPEDVIPLGVPADVEAFVARPAPEGL